MVPPPAKPDQAQADFHPASIDMVDQQHGWGVSQGHAGLYRTADGGRTWTNRTPPAMETCADLDLAALSADRAWLVLTCQPLANEEFPPVVVYRTEDGGAHWGRSQFVTTFRSLYGSAVHFLDDQRGFVLVEPEHGMGSGPGVLYSTADGGKSWTQVAGADRMPFAGKVGFSDNATGWAGLPVEAESSHHQGAERRVLPLGALPINRQSSPCPLGQKICITQKGAMMRSQGRANLPR